MNNYAQCTSRFLWAVYIKKWRESALFPLLAMCNDIAYQKGGCWVSALCHQLTQRTATSFKAAGKTAQRKLKGMYQRALEQCLNSHGSMELQYGNSLVAPCRGKFVIFNWSRSRKRKSWKWNWSFGNRIQRSTESDEQQNSWATKQRRNSNIRSKRIIKNRYRSAISRGQIEKCGMEGAGTSSIERSLKIPWCSEAYTR